MKNFEDIFIRFDTTQEMTDTQTHTQTPHGGINRAYGHGPSIQLGVDTVPACDHVRFLGVIISADLSLDRHVSIISSASFYWLRQLRRVRR